MAGENWTFWLNMTNYALGLITLLALLIVFGSVTWELAAQKLHKQREIDNLDTEVQTLWSAGSHSFSVPGLGLTMADGGERVKPSESQDSEEEQE